MGIIAENRGGQSAPERRGPVAVGDSPLARWARVIELTATHGLTGAQARVLSFVAFTDGGDGCYCALDTIAESAGVSRRAAVDALASLTAAGVIRRAGKRGPANRATIRYRFDA